MTAPDPALVTRFAGDLAALPGGDGRLLLAVSGGPDSVAMLILAHAAAPARVMCATVDHGLRAAAADEAGFVAGLCATLGVEHCILTLSLAGGGNVQARARAARYDALAMHAAEAGCGAILTAHHADDQAETLLMRASRGSGVAGLSGIRPIGHWGAVPLLRPLLGWRRSVLATIVADAGMKAVDDPSNRDPAHDRSRIRALIAATDDLDPAGLARSAAALADAADAIDWTMAALAEARITRDGAVCRVDPTGLPREYRRRLLARSLAESGVADARGSATDRLLATLDRGDAGMLGDIRVTIAAGIWELRAAPPRRSH